MEEKAAFLKEESLEFIQKLDLLKSHLYSNIEVKKLIEKYLSSKEEKLFLNYLEKEKISLDNREGIISLIKSLKEEFLNSKIIELTLAFDPSKKFLEKILLFLNSNLQEKYLVETIVNKKIIGGITLAVGGKFADFSLAFSIRESFPEGNFSRVLKNNA